VDRAVANLREAFGSEEDEQTFIDRNRGAFVIRVISIDRLIAQVGGPVGFAAVALARCAADLGRTLPWACESTSMS
jgi:hypothetical protein